MTAVLALSRAVVDFGSRRVLHDVSYEIQPAEVVALLGGNGSGKSTAVRTQLGLVPLVSGAATLFGEALSQFREWSRVGYVPQRVAAASGVPATVREVVSIGLLTNRGWWRPMARRGRDAVDDAIETVGLPGRASDRVHTLSGGQQQRVLIARALARRPEVLILDEPMAGVDLASQQSLADTVRALAHRGVTILIVLHELGPLADVINRAIVLRNGRVVHDGLPPPAAHGHAEHDHDHVHPHAAPIGSVLLP